DSICCPRSPSIFASWAEHSGSSSHLFLPWISSGRLRRFCCCRRSEWAWRSARLRLYFTCLFRRELWFAWPIAKLKNIYFIVGNATLHPPPDYFFKVLILKYLYSKPPKRKGPVGMLY